ncbi:RNA polymerase sigma factor [Bacillus sp. T33-2]|uniref:RNA polymerase sigma factor n=1 Tax=Bacillus sp. T33-2 TaxID=2054168 RepID=UPI000C770EFC|nr:RNA polymerase sigma factor [Bacillus sp. T33-2]PLR98411.1 RNA polymerase subunit sigma-70 [Bacillus sp. T33-2]
MSIEKELINRCREGDGGAFSELVEPYLNSAYRTAFVILKSKEHAEDALQNALINAYTAIMEHKEIRNFKPWFHRLVYSRSIDIVRKLVGLRMISIEEDSSVFTDPASVSIQGNLERKEQNEQILQSILALKPEQRIPIFLFYYHDLSIAEISKLLGENENTIKTRMTRGRKKLAGLLNFNHNVLEVSWK